MWVLVQAMTSPSGVARQAQDVLCIFSTALLGLLSYQGAKPDYRSGWGIPLAALFSSGRTGKAPIMVATAVKKLGHVRPVCYSRTRLYIAATTLERGNVIAAGCLLLEATRCYAMAMCEAHEIKPARSLKRAVRQLLKAKQLTDDGAEWLRECIKYGECCQRCRRVSPAEIEVSISLLHLLLDHSPELELPTRGGMV